jgi:hypothetical protein
MKNNTFEQSKLQRKAKLRCTLGTKKVLPKKIKLCVSSYGLCVSCFHHNKNKTKKFDFSLKKIL